MTDRELMEQVYQYLTGEAVRNKTTDKHIAELISEWLAQPEQEPLTDEEIDAIELPPSGTATVRDLVRVIERAHGIGEKE